MEDEGPDLNDEVDKLADEYVEMVLAGIAPDKDQYCARYPRYAPELRELIDIAEWLMAEGDWFRANFPGMRPSEFVLLPEEEQRRLLRSRRRMST